jgi:uncharacterized protein (DUF885 family)
MKAELRQSPDHRVPRDQLFSRFHFPLRLFRESFRDLPVCAPLWSAVVAFALILNNCSSPKPMNHFGNLKREYLDGLFLAKPHLATFMGDHRFDDRWPDLSPHGRELRLRVLQQQKLRLGSIERNRLTKEDQIDAEILADAIDLELLYLREIKEWERDPRLHDSFPYYDPREIVASRISDMVHGDFAPMEQRLNSVVSLLRGLPELLKQAQSQFGRPSRIYTEQAVSDNLGRIELFQGEVAEFIRAGKAAVGTKQVAEEAKKSALASLQDYQTFLEKELLPRSDGDWRLGQELFQKKFPLALQTRQTPETMVSESERAFRKSKTELYSVATELHREMFPNKALPKSQVEVIRHVKDALSNDHAQPGELVAAHRRNLDAFRGFIQEHDLLSLPPAETLVVREMPLFKRGTSAAEYLAPGILENRSGWTATYYVDPIDPKWDAARVESYLRGNNDYEVQLTAMHEAYPGHHTQFYYARKNLNPLRAVLWNAPFVEGWAVYGENLMVRTGYGSKKNARYRFFALRGDMIVATNAMIDVRLHCGQMTEQEAVRFMVEDGFQEQVQAEKKLLRAKLDTTQLSQYFLGFQEITQLENDVKKQAGSAFRQREFNENLIGHGSIAVKHLRSYFF